MKLSESMDMKGRLRLKMTNRKGQVVLDQTANNAIVFSGRDMVAKLFSNIEIKPISHIGIGSGSTPVDAENDTALENEIEIAPGIRKAITPIDPALHLVPAGGKIKVMISAELDFAEGNGAISEAGLFNLETVGDSSAVMYNRVVFPVVTKTNQFKLTLVWEVLF